jgi:hypothetical protein
MDEPEYWLRYDPLEDRFDFINEITGQVPSRSSIPRGQRWHAFCSIAIFRATYPLYRMGRRLGIWR